MKIALVIGHLGHGGAERQLSELAVGYRARGLSPHVYCLGSPIEPFGSWLRERGVPVTPIPRRGGFDVARVLRLASAWRRTPPDLAHSGLLNANLYTALAARITGGVPFVASNRNADFPRDRVRRALDRLAFRSARRVIVNATAVARFTASAFAVPSGRIDVVYNGVDLEHFRPGALRPDGPLRVGTVGSLTAKKNPQLFARLDGRLGSSSVELVHAGDGPLRSDLARAGSAVRYLGALDDPAELLRSLDLFVLTSRREGCPNVILEAMATAVPVVSTDAGGVSEIVVEGESGFVVPQDDFDTLADRARELLADAPMRERLGRRAREIVSERFTLERMIAGTLAVHHGALGPAIAGR